MLGTHPDRDGLAHRHLGLGKPSGRSGQRQQAHERFTTMTGMYGEIDMRFWLAQAEAEVMTGSALIVDGDSALTNSRM